MGKLLQYNVFKDSTRNVMLNAEKVSNLFKESNLRKFGIVC